MAFDYTNTGKGIFNKFLNDKKFKVKGIPIPANGSFDINEGAVATGPGVTNSPILGTPDTQGIPRITGGTPIPSQSPQTDPTQGYPYKALAPLESTPQVLQGFSNAVSPVLEEGKRMVENQAPGLKVAQENNMYVPQAKMESLITDLYKSMPDASDEELAEAMKQMGDEGYIFEGFNDKNIDSPMMDKWGIKEGREVLGGALGAASVVSKIPGGVGTMMEGTQNISEGNTNLGASQVFKGATDVGMGALTGAFPATSSLFMSQPVAESPIGAGFEFLGEKSQQAVGAGLNLTGMDQNSPEYQNYLESGTAITTLLTTLGLFKGGKKVLNKTFGENVNYNSTVGDFVKGSKSTMDDFGKAASQAFPNRIGTITEKTPLSQIFTPDEFSYIKDIATSKGVPLRKEGIISDAFQDKTLKTIGVGIDKTLEAGVNISRKGVEMGQNLFTKTPKEKAQPINPKEGNAVNSEGHVYTQESPPSTASKIYKGIFTKGDNEALASRAVTPSVSGKTTNQKINAGAIALTGLQRLHNDATSGKVSTDVSTMDGGVEGIQQGLEYYGGKIGELTGVDGSFNVGSELKNLQTAMNQRGASITPDLNTITTNILKDFAQFGPEITISEAQQLLSTIKSNIFSDPARIKQLSSTISGSGLDEFIKAFEAKFQEAIDSLQGNTRELADAKKAYSEYKAIQKDLINSYVVELRNQAKSGGLSNAMGNVGALMELVRKPSISSLASSLLIKAISQQIGKGKTRNAAYEKLMQNLKSEDMQRAKGKMPIPKKKEYGNIFEQNMAKQGRKKLPPAPEAEVMKEKTSSPDITEKSIVRRPTTQTPEERVAVAQQKRTTFLNNIKNDIASDTKSARYGGTGNTRVEAIIDAKLAKGEITKEEALAILEDVKTNKRYQYIDQKALDAYIEKIKSGKVESFEEMIAPKEQPKGVEKKQTHKQIYDKLQKIANDGRYGEKSWNNLASEFKKQTGQDIEDTSFEDFGDDGMITKGVPKLTKEGLQAKVNIAKGKIVSKKKENTPIVKKELKPVEKDFTGTPLYEKKLSKDLVSKAIENNKGKKVTVFLKGTQYGNPKTFEGELKGMELNLGLDNHRVIIKQNEGLMGNSLHFYENIKDIQIDGKSIFDENKLHSEFADEILKRKSLAPKKSTKGIVAPKKIENTPIVKKDGNVGVSGNMRPIKGNQDFLEYFEDLGPNITKEGLKKFGFTDDQIAYYSFDFLKSKSNPLGASLEDLFWLTKNWKEVGPEMEKLYKGASKGQSKKPLVKPNPPTNEQQVSKPISGDTIPEATPKVIRKVESKIETLPEDVNVYDEAKRVGVKRISPDRVAHQKLTPEEGIQGVIDKKIANSTRNYEAFNNYSKEIDTLSRKYGEKFPTRMQAQKMGIEGYDNDLRIWDRIEANLKGYGNVNKLSYAKEIMDRKANHWKQNIDTKDFFLESSKKEYIDLIKDDISKGYKYPDEVIKYDPSFSKAVTSRERYEKGLNTSFGADDSRIVFDEVDSIGAGMKRQDGKAITPDQKTEIISGVKDFSDALGLDMKKLAEKERWVYVHLNGKNPFLMKDIAGLYRKDVKNKSVSISVGGIETFDKLDIYGRVMKDAEGKIIKEKVNTTVAHELGHAIDYLLDNKLFSNFTVSKLTESMNRNTEAFRSNRKYYTKKQEVVARMIEQYVAESKGHTGIRQQTAQWSKEIFENEIKPLVETAIKENFPEFIKPKKIFSTEIPEGYFKNAFGEIQKNPSNKKGGFIKIPEIGKKSEGIKVYKGIKKYGASSNDINIDARRGLDTEIGNLISEELKTLPSYEGRTIRTSNSIFGKDISEIKIGDIVSDKGFLSSSKNKSKIWGDYGDKEIIINSKTGKDITKIKGKIYDKYEPEILFDKNTKFVVKNIKGNTVYIEEQSKSPVNNPLVEEARKYKSAEEFVKSQGEPVYHGTLADFESFDMGKAGTNTNWENAKFGTFFLDDAQKAKEFPDLVREPGDNRPVKVKKAFIELKNPIDLTIEGIFTKEKQAPIVLELLGGEKMPPKEALQFLKDEIGLGEIGDLKEALYGDIKNKSLMQKAGYDGIISDYGDGIIEKVVFDTKQIKTESQLKQIYEQAHNGIKRKLGISRKE